MTEPKTGKRMNVFERYLSLWVAACMVLGVAIGKLAPGLVGADAGHGVRHREPHQHPDRHPHLADDLPMMLKIDFASIRTSEAPGRAGDHPGRELAG